MLEFGALPPEVNSTWIYTGPGSAPLMAAAAAWHTLAAELGSTGAAYQAIVDRMTGEQWAGPASASMLAAAAPHVAWLNTTATQAEQAATQAGAAAAAFETAFAMTVPPPVIVANRSLLAMLVATNFLGQNTPAIATTEAHYAQMWAQDAAAMYGYAGSSAAAAQVTPFTEPSQTTNPAGLGGQAAAVAAAGGTATGSQSSEISQLISALPTALQSLTSPLQANSSSSGLTEVLSGLLNPSAVTDNVNGMVNTGAWNVASTLSTALGFLSNMGSSAGSAMGSAMSSGLGATGSLSAAGFGGMGALGGLGGLGGAAVTSSIGQAGSVGMLSVPPTWAASAAVNPATTVSAVQGTGWSIAPEGGASAVPAGMPFGGAGARAIGGANAPQYGFKPTVVIHPVLAG